MDLKDIKHIANNPLTLKKHLSHGSLVFVNDEYTALMVYYQVNDHCLEAHVESLPEARGCKLKKFCIESGKQAFIKSGNDVKSVLNFVDEDDKRLILFSGTFAERVGKVNNKILFVTERERYL